MDNEPIGYILAAHCPPYAGRSRGVIAAEIELARYDIVDGRV